MARNLQAELDAEAVRIAACAARPPPGPSITISRSARPSGTPRHPTTRSTGAPPTRLKRQRADGIPHSKNAIPEDFVAPGFRYPPQGGIRTHHHATTAVVDTPLLTNPIVHPSSLVRRCEVPTYFRIPLLLLAFHDSSY